MMKHYIQIGFFLLYRPALDGRAIPSCQRHIKSCHVCVHHSHATGSHRVSSWPMLHSRTVHEVQEKGDMLESQIPFIVRGFSLGENVF